jgi:pimeloyl-ACP methyl ester carboxylesterase
MIFMAFVAIAAFAIGALFLRDLRRARARLIGRSKTIATPFGELEYALLGEGEPVLVIHGAGGGFDQSLDMLGPLAELGYRLIAPSRFGYLRSASPADPTSAKQADAYALLLDRLGVQQADVVAVSAGAWSALQFAVRRPDRCRALVLVVPAPLAPPQANDAAAAFVRAMFGSDFLAWPMIRLAPILPAAATRAILGSDPALLRAAEPSERARARQILDRLLPVGPRRAGMAFDIGSAANPEPCAIDKIACPVLTISAADDAFGTAARAKAIAAGVANGAAVIYPSGGHALIGDYEEARDEIVAFLSGPPEERGASPPAGARP